MQCQHLLQAHTHERVHVHAPCIYRAPGHVPCVYRACTMHTLYHAPTLHTPRATVHDTLRDALRDAPCGCRCRPGSLPRRSTRPRAPGGGDNQVTWQSHMVHKVHHKVHTVHHMVHHTASPLLTSTVLMNTVFLSTSLSTIRSACLNVEGAGSPASACLRWRYSLSGRV